MNILIKLFLSIIFVCTFIFGSMIEDERINNTFIKFLENTVKNKQSIKKLLIPVNFKNELAVTKNYKNFYKTFIEKRKVIKMETDRNKLHALYLKIFKDISKSLSTSPSLLALKDDYIMRILKKLKEDFKEEYFSKENKDVLMINVKKILLNKSMVYESQKRVNIFYAQNMKRYISITAKIPLDMVDNNDIFKKFLNFLNEGEKLILEGIDCNSFEKLENFIKKLEVSNEKIQSLLKIKNINPSMFWKKYIDYWIRGKVELRYLDINNILEADLKFIKKEKIFFDDL